MPSTSDPKATSSVHAISDEKPPFGSRFLTDEAEVWSQNAWDHVLPPDDQDEVIAASLSRQSSAPVPEDEKIKYNANPSRHWDNFYKMNSSNFFQNRKWLHNEFPELVDATLPEAGPVTIAEIGCGAGNSVFPLLSSNKNPKLFLQAYDYSSHAVKLVQSNPLYQSPPVGSIYASVWDLTSKDGLPAGMEPGSVDIVVLVFVISALQPDEWDRAIVNIHKMLKPGGLVVLRDYGRYDLTQLRFKSGRLLEQNFYIRGDKTRVYFFELDELALLFTGSRAVPSHVTGHTTEKLEDEDLRTVSGPQVSDAPGMDTTNVISTPCASMRSSTAPLSSNSMCSPIHPRLLAPSPERPPHPLFKIEQLGVDRRLLVNRKRQLKMYRVWMQGKFRKITG